jgi:hypothetical protein
MLKINISNKPAEPGGSLDDLGSRIGDELMEGGFGVGSGFMPGTSVQTQKCRPKSIMIWGKKSCLHNLNITKVTPF